MSIIALSVLCIAADDVACSSPPPLCQARVYTFKQGFLPFRVMRQPRRFMRFPRMSFELMAPSASNRWSTHFRTLNPKPSGPPAASRLESADWYSRTQVVKLVNKTSNACLCLRLSQRTRAGRALVGSGRRLGHLWIPRFN